jgi:hypothetical protein
MAVTSKDVLPTKKISYLKCFFKCTERLQVFNEKIRDKLKTNTRRENKFLSSINHLRRGRMEDFLKSSRRHFQPRKFSQLILMTQIEKN